MTQVSAGILLYRWRGPDLELLVAHPGGPIWAKRDEGAWSIPKGLAEQGEDLASAGRREFHEETGFPVPEGELVALGETRLKSGKVVHAWAAKGDIDPAELRSNDFTMEWPPRSGRMSSFPEIDRVAWVTPEQAVTALNPAQAVFVERLLKHLLSPADS